MAELVCMDPPEAGPTRCCGHDLRDTVGAEGLIRCEEPDEDRPALSSRWSPSSQIGSDRRTDVGGDREARGARSFPTHDHFAGPPGDILEPKVGHFAGA
jgi:hypothetical protein